MDLYPKLRTIVEPTLFSQRLKVISDEIHINALFDDAFKIKKTFLLIHRLSRITRMSFSTSHSLFSRLYRLNPLSAKKTSC